MTSPPAPISAIVLAWFREADYATHVAIDPESMKPRFRDWLKDAKRAEKDIKARGLSAYRVLVDPKELIAWAALRGRNINPETRALFVFDAVAAANREPEQGAGEGQ